MRSSRPPTVTVALPVFNGERYLGSAIESVLAQEGVDIELHVVDNCSSDGTRAIAERYLADPRVRVTTNETNINALGSLNRALADSEARYFCPFAGHDDLMLPGNLARKVAVLEETGAGFVHSYARLIDEHGAAFALSEPLEDMPALTPAPGFFRYSGPVNRVVCQSVVGGRECFLAVGGFDARIPYCGDWLMWMRLALRYPVATIHEPLVDYRVHRANASHAGLADGSHAAQVPAAQAHVFADEALSPELAPLRAAMVGERLRLTAEDLERAGLLRAANGYGACLLAARALAELPDEPRVRETYARLVGRAGLAAPDLPLDAVAYARPGEGAGLVAAAAALGPLLARLAIAAPAQALAALVPELESALAAAPALELDLVAAPSLAPLLAPGRVLLAPFGSPLAAEAEAAGVPVFPTSLPDPFALPRDPASWQVVPVPTPV